MNRDLTVGKPENVLLRFCMPLFASVLFQQLYNVADSFVAGKFISNGALAAVGNSYEITLIFIAFAFGCNIGVSVITSRYFGAADYGKMKTVIFTGLISTGVLCAVLMISGFVFSDELLTLINTPADIFSSSKEYLDIYILSLPFVFFYNVATGIFSALGDSKTPFVFLACSSLANIAVDILFVARFGMGVPGVALATLICQGVSCILSLFFVFKRLKKMKIKGKTVWFSADILKQIVKIAIPSTLQQSFISVGNIILQSIINSFGSGVIAGYSASVKLNNAVITSFTAFGNGISNYTSQNIGAEKFIRIKQGFKAGLKIVMGICIPVAVIYFVFGNRLVYMFLENPTGEAAEVGTEFLKTVAPFYIIIAVKLVSDGILRGYGRMNRFMVATFTDLIIRILLAEILSATSLGTTGIWLSWPIGWIVGTLLSVLFYKKTVDVNRKSQ